MQPIDTASERFNHFLGELTPEYWAAVRTEADVRQKVIDRIFVEILGWPVETIHCEDKAGKGFIDYRFTVDKRTRLIVEAKRESRDLEIAQDKSGRYFKLNGPVLNGVEAKDGILQAVPYCAFKGAELACVTNGKQWIIFLGKRLGEGEDVLEGMACVFSSLESIKENFTGFFDLLSFDAVRTYKYRGLFQEAEHNPIRTSTFCKPLTPPSNRTMLPADKLYADLDRLMASFFREITDSDDADMLEKCFVATSDSDEADAGILRISEGLLGRVQELHTLDGQELTAAIKRVSQTQKKEFILIAGTKGAGKSTFIDRFFRVILPDEIAKNCVIIRVDLSQCGVDEHEVAKWLNQHVLDATETAVYAGDVPKYDDLVGMYNCPGPLLSDSGGTWIISPKENKHGTPETDHKPAPT